MVSNCTFGKCTSDFRAIESCVQMGTYISVYRIYQTSTTKPLFFWQPKKQQQHKNKSLRHHKHATAASLAVAHPVRMLLVGHGQGVLLDAGVSVHTVGGVIPHGHSRLLSRIQLHLLGAHV